MSGVDLRWLIGQTVTEISYIEPMSWRFTFSDSTTLRVDTLWRLVVEHIKITSDDHGHKFGLAEPVDSGERARHLIGQAKVREAAVLQATGDLSLQFENGTRLEILTTSAGYESWELASPAGATIIALGGGRIDVGLPQN